MSASSQPAPERLVRCPSCGEPSRYAPDNPWRPFCSQRCRLTDLGAWANESFRVEAAEDPDLNDISPAPPRLS